MESPYSSLFVTPKLVYGEFILKNEDTQKITL